MPQTLLPDADLVKVDWKDELDGTTDIFNSINEPSHNPADFIIGAVSPDGTKPYRCSLTPGDDPNSTGKHTVEVHLRKDLAGGARMDFQVDIYDGNTSTLIATGTITDVPETTVLFEFDLTVAEITNISGAAYTGGDIEVEVTPVEIA